MLDATTTPRWAVLAALVPLCLLIVFDAARFPRLLWACLTVAGVSLFWTPMFYIGADEALKLAFLAGAFWLGVSLIDARPLWEGLIAGVLLSVAFAAMQAFGYDAIPQSAAPGGLFGNRNFLADACTVALIAAVLMRHWAPAALLLVAIALAGSKATIVALLLVGAAWFAPRRPLVSWGLLGMVCALAVLLLSMWHDSVSVRFEIWVVALAGIVPFGHGIGSFAATYPGYEHVHNEPLQLIYEYGILSAPFFLLAFTTLKGWSDEVELEALVLLAVGAIACFSFPLHMPVTALAASVAAGRLYGARDRMVQRRAVWGTHAYAHV